MTAQNLHSSPLACRVYFYLLSSADDTGRTILNAANVADAFGVPIKESSDAFHDLKSANLLAYDKGAIILSGINIDSDKPDYSSDFLTEVCKPTQFKENICRQLHISASQYDTAAQEIVAEWEFVGNPIRIDRECKQHFVNHLRLKIKTEKPEECLSSVIQRSNETLKNGMPWLQL